MEMFVVWCIIAFLTVLVIYLAWANEEHGGDDD